MSEFDNLYFCPKCGHVDLLHTDDMNCDNCDFESCVVARHINEGIRKHWIKVESRGPSWRREKRVSTIVKKHIPDDKKTIKEFNRFAKHMFDFLDNNRDKMDEIFPKFTRDYKRTTGERDKGWKNTRSAAQTNRDFTRGVLYEGAFQKAYVNHNQFERIYEPITYVNDNQEEKEFEPDAWFIFEENRIPVEFKTYGEGSLVESKFNKGLRQSRKYGRLSNRYFGNNPNEYSGLIICSPEERKFASVLMDSRIDRIL